MTVPACSRVCTQAPRWARKTPWWSGGTSTLRLNFTAMPCYPGTGRSLFPENRVWDSIQTQTSFGAFKSEVEPTLFQRSMDGDMTGWRQVVSAGGLLLLSLATG